MVGRGSRKYDMAISDSILEGWTTVYQTKDGEVIAHRQRCGAEAVNGWLVCPLREALKNAVTAEDVRAAFATCSNISCVIRCQEKVTMPAISGWEEIA